MTHRTAPFQTNVTPARAPLRLAAGYLFLAIGFAGLFLPLLPTTIFWIIAAICFARSSPDMYRRILAWPRIGTAIGAFIDHGVIRPAGKRFALGGMAASAFVMILLDMNQAVLTASLVGLACAAAFVMTRPGTCATVAAPASVIAKQE